ncbi:DUF4190 domain-containing protein [Arenimonas sp.]|uniref:DUF4190 domain-containing protein n=1 Tax=Arenimonas sp. TaxID=1872635 RepID=UPI0035B49945
MNMVPRQTSALAITSLVCGLLGWTFLPLLGSLVAIITGHMARSEIRQSNGQLEGDGLAIAGLVLGWITIALAVAAVLAIVLFFGGLAAVLGLSGQL